MPINWDKAKQSATAKDYTATNKSINWDKAKQSAAEKDNIKPNVFIPQRSANSGALSSTAFRAADKKNLTDNTSLQPISLPGVGFSFVGNDLAKQNDKVTQTNKALTAASQKAGNLQPYQRVLASADSGAESAIGGSLNALQTGVQWAGDKLGKIFGTEEALKDPKNQETLKIMAAGGAFGPSSVLTSQGKEAVLTPDKLFESAQTKQAAALDGTKGVGKFALESVGSITNMATGAALSGVTGLPFAAQMGVQAGGGAAYDAKQQGKTLDQQFNYGLTTGISSGLIESIGGIGTAKVVKSAAKNFASSLLSKLPTGIAQWANTTGAKVAGKILGDAIAEGGEEATQYSLDLVLQKLTLNNDVPFDIKQMAYQALQGGVIGGLFGASSSIANAATQKPTTTNIQSPVTTEAQQQTASTPVQNAPQSKNIGVKKNADQIYTGNMKNYVQLYHGGNVSPSTFDVSKASNESQFGSGFYAGSSSYANEWAQERGGSTHPVELDTTNYFDEYNINSADPRYEKVKSLLVDFGFSKSFVDNNFGGPGTLDWFAKALGKRSAEKNTMFPGGSTIKSILQSAGFNGAIAEFRDSKQYVAYSDDSIKSQNAPQATMAAAIQSNAQKAITPTTGNAAAENKVITPSQSDAHIDNRTYESVSNRKVNAFQFDNPVVHPHYAEAARLMLIDLKESIRGERYAVKDAEGYIIGSGGTKRSTTPEIERLLDNAKLSYPQIQKALEDIIADHGQENYAAAKKVELVLDDALTNGFTALDGTYVEPSEEYINLKSGASRSEYSMSEEDWNSLVSSMPEGMGANNNTDDLGAAKGGLYKTNQWAGDTKHNINKKPYDVPDTLPETAAKVDLSKPKKSGGFARRWRSFYTHVVDNQHAINRVSKIANSDTAMLASNARGAGQVVDNILNRELVDRDGNPIGDSLYSIMQEIPKNDMGAFFEYMLFRHNVGRSVMDKNVFKEYNVGMSKAKVAELEKAHPDWKPIADKIVNWIDTFETEWGVNSGLIGADIYNNLRSMYPDYIPTQREFSEVEMAMTGGDVGQKFVDNNSTIKTAKGNSDRDIHNPIANIANLVNTTVKTATYNRVGQSLYEAVKANPTKMQPFAEIVAEPSVRNNVVSVLVNGKRVYLKINDVELLEALNGIPKATKAIPFLGSANNLFKGLVTQYNILFAFRNFMRDIVTGYGFGSQSNPFKYLAGEAKAIKDIITNGERYRRYRGVGGGMSNFVSKNSIEKYAYGLTKDQGKVRKFIGKVGSGVVAFNNAIETATRLNEFNAVYAKTGDPQKALDASNNVAVNFARGGDVTKVVDKNFVPYLNASVQGLDRFVRSFSSPRAAVSTILKAGLSTTLPTLIMYLINKDNPHYEDEDDRTKDAYYLIPNYLGPVDDEGYAETFIKLPRSREFGVLFGALFERIFRWAQGENPDSAFKGLGTSFATTFKPVDPTTSNLFSAATLNLMSNKDFAGRTIVPQSMQTRSPHLQYDEKTSELTKFIADMAYKTVGAEFSPKVMDYLIDSYFGIVGDVLLPATTKGSGGALKPVIRAFTTDSVYSNQAVADFYDNMDKAATVAADKNLLEGIPSDQLTFEEKVSNTYRKSSEMMGVLSKISARAGVGAMTQDDIDALKALGIDTTLPTVELQREIKKEQVQIAKDAIARAERGNEMELDIFNDSNIAEGVKKYEDAAKITTAQAYKLYQTLSDMEKANGTNKDLSIYEKISTVLKQPITNTQKTSIIATYYTKHDTDGNVTDISLLPYLNNSDKLVSLYIGSKDADNPNGNTDLINMKIPAEFSDKPQGAKSSITYALTEAEKKLFQQKYTEYFNSRITALSTAEDIKKIINGYTNNYGKHFTGAYEYAKQAVIQGRG